MNYAEYQKLAQQQLDTRSKQLDGTRTRVFTKEVLKGARKGSVSSSDGSSVGTFKKNIIGFIPLGEKIESTVARFKKEIPYDVIQPFRRIGVICPTYLKEALHFPGLVQAQKLLSNYEACLQDKKHFGQELDEKKDKTEKELAAKSTSLLKK